MSLFRSIISFVFLATIFLAPYSAHAQGLLQGDGFGRYFQSTFESSEGAGLGEQGDLQRSLPLVIGSIIQTILGFVSTLLLLLITYAGFLWLTAQGDSAQVDKAKTIIKNGAIGIAVCALAFVITSLVVNGLNQAFFVDGPSS